MKIFELGLRAKNIYDYFMTKENLSTAGLTSGSRHSVIIIKTQFIKFMLNFKTNLQFEHIHCW